MTRNAAQNRLEAQREAAGMAPWMRLAAMPLLGAAAALAMPPTDLWLLMICVSLGFALTRAEGWRRAALMGFLCGFGYFIVALHWIGFAFLVDPDAYLWMMPFAVGGLAAFLALYWGLAFAAARQLMRLSVPWYAAFPATLAAAEYLRGVLFTGFPWAAPGLAADGMGGVAQAASLVGMQGLTFWLLLWGSLAVALVLRHIRARIEMAAAALLLLLLPGLWFWGEAREQAMPSDAVPGVRLLLVQPNVPQDQKWQDQYAGGIFDTLLRLSAPAGEKPTHIIWPESAVPFLIDEEPAAQQRLAEVLADDQVLMTGAIRRQAGQSGDDFFTSILMFDGAGAVRGMYDKWRLVPGGEFLPLAWLLEPLGFRKVVSLPESFTAGSGPHGLDIPGAGRAGLLICYEVIFPQQLVDAARRPDWLLNVTNDAWFGLSTGPYQHLAQARLRAIEQNLPVVRAANSGISAIIDGAGRYRARSKLGEQTELAGTLPKAGQPTLFSTFGLWAVSLPALAILLLLGLLRNRSLITQAN